MSTTNMQKEFAEAHKVDTVEAWLKYIAFAKARNSKIDLAWGSYRLGRVYAMKHEDCYRAQAIISQARGLFENMPASRDRDDGLHYTLYWLAWTYEERHRNSPNQEISYETAIKTYIESAKYAINEQDKAASEKAAAWCTEELAYLKHRRK